MGFWIQGLADEGDGKLGARHGHAGLLDEGLLYLRVGHDAVGDLGRSCRGLKNLVGKDTSAGQSTKKKALPKCPYTLKP